MDERKVIKISRKKFIIFIIILVLILIFWGMSSFLSRNMFGVSSTNISAPTAPTVDLGYDYYEKGGQQPSITDTREFLKTSYSGNIQTRNVSEMMKEVRNTVKGFDGRVDNFYSSEKNGHLSFVVAKSKFEEFRSEIEGLTYAKLYTESISSENLLSQKQEIERQTENILSILESLRKQKDDLGLKHTQTVNAINRELANIRAELVDVRAYINEEPGTEKMSLLRDQESSLLTQENSQKQRLSTENNNYTAQNQNLENLINNANNNLTNVNQQSTQFMENIETVNGVVYVNWVSLWQLAKIYSPIHPTFVIIILVLFAWGLLRYRGYIPKIVLE